MTVDIDPHMQIQLMKNLKESNDPATIEANIETLKELGIDVANRAAEDVNTAIKAVHAALPELEEMVKDL
jgi:hypothetical protein